MPGLEMRRNIPLEETAPHIKELAKFSAVFNKESERGLTLVACSMIDALLERSIQALLTEHPDTIHLLNGFNAPLGTFSARILAAFALGLISENEYEECNRLRKIRNIFAHNIYTSFKDQQIIDLCSNLEFSTKELKSRKLRMDSKGEYGAAALLMIANLTNRPKYVSLQRLKYGEWPY
jgi:hypothetical protein